MNPNDYSSNSNGTFYFAIAAAVVIIAIIIGAFMIIGADSDNNPDTLPGQTSASSQSTATSSTGDLPALETGTLPILDTENNDATPGTETEPVESIKKELTPEQIEFIEAQDNRIIPPFAVSDYESLYPNSTLGTTEDGGHEYLNRITFLGDSTTYGLKSYRMLAGGKETKQVLTPLSGTLTLAYAAAAKVYVPDAGTEMTINDAIKHCQPDILVITLGVNGVAFMNETYFKTEYSKIIKGIAAVSPDTKIILQSMFPVARSYRHIDQINNEKISAGNGWIAALADSLSEEYGVRYIDTASALVDEEGHLPEHLQNGDGMHLNEAGYEIELDYIRVHMYE